MTNFMLGALSLILGAAFVCRVDLLSWRGHPVLMFLHVVGGVASVWVLKEAASGAAYTLNNIVTLGCSTLLLVATWRLLPEPGCAK